MRSGSRIRAYTIEWKDSILYMVYMVLASVRGVSLGRVSRGAWAPRSSRCAMFFCAIAEALVHRASQAGAPEGGRRSGHIVRRPRML